MLEIQMRQRKKSKVKSKIKLRCNAHHPELKKGELFLANEEECFMKFSKHATLRMGKRAYNARGLLLESDGWGGKMYPYFIKQHEFLEKYGQEEVLLKVKRYCICARTDG